jgi:hypothetical protein
MVKNVSLPTQGPWLTGDGDYCHYCDLGDHHPEPLHSCANRLITGRRTDLTFVDGTTVQNPVNGEYYTFTEDRIFMQTGKTGHYKQSSLISFVEFVRVYIDGDACQSEVAEGCIDIHTHKNHK